MEGHWTVTLAQQLVNGLTVGSVYALVALGYTMVYGVLRMINFAHGELFTLGAFLFLSLAVAGVAQRLALPPALGVLVLALLAMAAVAVVGALVERVAYRPLRRSTRLAPLVSALGMSVFLQNAIMLLWGARPQAVPTERLLAERAIALGPVQVSTMQLAILGVSLLLMAALHAFVHRTVTGAAIRAVAQDHDAARLMGIDVDRIIALIFLIGPALGAAAGVMVGLYYRKIDFFMGFTYGLKAFIAAVLGGIGNIPGAMLGGLVLGVLETLAAGYVSAGWKDAIALVILVLILVVRPTGLLGERVAEKV